MSIRNTSIHEDGSTTVRTVPGRILLDQSTGTLYNPESANRPNVRVQWNSGN